MLKNKEKVNLKRIYFPDNAFYLFSKILFFLEFL